MGEFTQNLLKLTEFPFSYSLFGLLALMFGQGIDPQKLSFAQIGPLLILMGFFATTLSICDPVGGLQRLSLSFKGDRHWFTHGASWLFYRNMWGKNMIDIFPAPYFFAIAYSPEGIKKRTKIKIDWDIVERKFFERKEFSPKSKQKFERLPSSQSARDAKLEKHRRAKERLRERYEEELDKLGQYDLLDIGRLLKALKEQTIRTKWVTAEVDKITALIYFMIVISVFIVATVVVEDFLPKFAQPFGHNDSSKIGILAFSFIALFGVTIMYILRSGGLNAKTLIVFKYLTSLGTIKTSKDKFTSSLDDVERYLNDNHWALAEYWVNRIEQDYSEIFLEEVKKPTEVTKSPTGVR